MGSCDLRADMKWIPDRYVHHELTSGEYAVHPDVSKRDHFGFGGGRRICPGMHVAERSVFLNLASLLWGFNIEYARDENGEIIPVDDTWNGLVPGALSNAIPFKCCMLPPLSRYFWRIELTWGVAIKVRSEKRERI